MQSVEISYIREILRELYKGKDFENSWRNGNFSTDSYAKRVSQRLFEKLGEEHTDRIYVGSGLNKNINTMLKRLLGKSSKSDAISIEYSVKSNKRPRNSPIIDFDSDVSSEDGTMDQSTLDSQALMDSMENSVLNVSTRSTSGLVEKLEAKVCALEAQNRALEARAKAAEDACRLWQEKSRDLFKVQYRPTRENRSGRCEVFDSRLDAIVLDAENRGVAAKHVHDVCKAFVDVLGWFDEDDQSHRKVFIIIRTVRLFPYVYA